MKLNEYVGANEYPGRGIAVGRTADGKKGVLLYFIMGRSENSRNREFIPEKRNIRTAAVDESKMTDPSLVIYYPVKTIDDWTIVTNGDQTDTIYDEILDGGCFRDALLTREYEPDAPNFTPRISSITKFMNNKVSSIFSIIRKDEDSDICRRFFNKYGDIKSGTAYIIHTYEKNGDPIPSFKGEPVELEIDGDINEIGDSVWDALNFDNKVSLFVRTVDLEDNSIEETKIFNKYASGGTV